MTAAIVLLMCWTVLLLAAESPIGRFLNRVMVETPSEIVSRLEPGHIALAIVVTMLVVLHLNTGDGDPTRMVGLIAPDIALWLASLEISAIVEATIALMAALAALSRMGIAAVLAAFSISLPRHAKNKVKRARSGFRRKRILPANDDEDGTEFALAS